ncbi:NAD(P)-dependent oxidoreductase [Snuella sedimenti]|uniref:D-3-phosphoglycerate dehydrogenase n=1 Tax=Snuella sedimenti TaxID=2798802 RepID=A0A8J7JB41_9FLAO|nr:NAD(P)-dependent oxidoreductase [Snuella sedimenti]MBJ6367819.1 hypothetical protein [Snuella sedimenti]
MNILIIDPLSENTICRLKKIKSVKIDYFPNINETDILEKIGQASMLIMRTSHIFTEQWLEKAVQLQAVIIAGSGIENVPIDLLEANNIIFKNVKEASVTSVAEYAICLILMGLRNVYQGIKSIGEGNWEKNQLIGNEIRRKTIGLIGFGNIGKAIASLLCNFDVEIIYTNESGRVVGYDYECVELKELAKRSDIICIQVPLTNRTYQFINNDVFSNVKRDCVLINVSRYDVIAMDALIEKLKQGIFKHVYIDPIEKRHLKTISEFKNLPISFLPHLGANTYEAQERVGEELIKIMIDLETKFNFLCSLP